MENDINLSFDSAYEEFIRTGKILDKMLNDEYTAEEIMDICLCEGW